MRRSGGGASIRRKPTGFRGGIPDAEAIFYRFIQKYAFLSILWCKFLLKTRL